MSGAQTATHAVRGARGTSSSLASTVVIEKVVGAAPDDRIQVIRRGFPAGVVTHLADELGWNREHAIDALKLKRSTVLRKIKEHQLLDSPDSERLLSVLDMIAQVQQIVARSGDATGFDAARWLATWLDAPCPALGGQKPTDYLDTHEGIQVVRNLLSQMESGAYA